MTTTGEAIRQERVRHGVSGRALARELRRSERFVRDIEAGRAPVPQKLFAALQAALPGLNLEASAPEVRADTPAEGASDDAFITRFVSEHPSLRFVFAVLEMNGHVDAAGDLLNALAWATQQPDVRKAFGE
jgi:transcriptional regulator with XRE-family HTH domain